MAEPLKNGFGPDVPGRIAAGGHPGALALLGFEPGSPVTVESVQITPERVSIGDSVHIEAVVHNDTVEVEPVAVDLRIHFVKANEATAAKVFKGTELDLGAGERARVRQTVSVAQHTTRSHYPGRHVVEIVLNGAVAGTGWFMIGDG